MDHLSTCIVGRMETVHVASECDIFTPLVPSKRRRYTSKKISSPSPKISTDKKSEEVGVIAMVRDYIETSPNPNPNPYSNQNPSQKFYRNIVLLQYGTTINFISGFALKF